MKVREGTLVAKRRRFVGGVTATLGAVAALSLVFVSGALAAQPPVSLGTTASYAVLAGSTVTNTGPSVVTGDLGLSPGSSVTGFPPGLVIGNVNVANAAAVQAQSDLTTAYNDAAGRTPATTVAGDTLGGLTLTAGVYSGGALDLTGTLTLDAQGDSSAVFIFQAASTLITASSSQVSLINGASHCNIFWQVGSSATLGTTTSFKGTILALTSITLTTGATVDGRMLARTGAVTLDSNTINAQACSAAPPVRTPTTIVTQVHNPGHADITNGSALPGTAVHDSATVTGASPSGTVTYHFYASGQGSCSGPSADQTVPVGAESSPQTLAVGSYAYSADYSGDANNQPSTGVCEPFSIKADTSPPICVIVGQGTDALGRGFLRFAVTDVGSGLNRHDITYRKNAAVDIESYSPGALGPVNVLATAIDATKSFGVEVRFYDLAGKRAICDPIVTVVRRIRAQPKDQTFKRVARAECKVTITNGRPGMREVWLIVNGRRYRAAALKKGEVRKINICAAMRSGNRNKITVRARGKKGASAVVMIANID